MGAIKRAHSMKRMFTGLALLAAACMSTNAAAQYAPNCSPAEINGCFSRCNSRTTPAAKNLCTKMCGMGQQSCADGARDTRINTPDNSSNPLTRFYPNRAAMQADPKFPAARKAWMSCLYRRPNIPAPSTADYERCKRLDPKNSIRR